MYTKKQLYAQLEEMNAPNDSVVMVHSSLKAVGETEGRGEGLLEVLIDYFTSYGGLLCFPTHTWAFGSRSPEPVLDMTSSETCVGKLSQLAAEHKDALRSCHPTHSVAVFGDRIKANDYILYDSIATTPAHPSGAFGKLYTMDGYVMLLGVGHNKNTYIHSVEEMYEVQNRLTEYTKLLPVKHPSGVTVKRYCHCHWAKGIGDVSAHYPNYEPAFRYHGGITDGILGEAKVQLCSARIMKEVIGLIRERSGGAELLADDTPVNEIFYK